MNLSMVPLGFEHYEFVRGVRNDIRVKAGFIIQDEISIEEHLEYMSANNKSYFVCLRGSIPVGYVGVVDNDIRVATAPDEVKAGVGEFMVNFIAEKFPDALAKVKLENIASQKLFEKCGYKPTFVVFSKIDSL